MKGVELPQDEPVVIAPLIVKFTVERMLVDTGSSADILYLSTYDKLQLPPNHIQPIATPPTRFTGHVVYPLRIATPDLMVRTENKTTTIKAQFTVVDINDPSYNGLIGRSILTALRAIVSLLHLKLKFPTAGGIGEACGNQKKARICYEASVPPVNKPTAESGKKYCRKNQLEIRTVRKGEKEDN
ncbi:hypothetical protein LIER_15298 [Lithospermum erythrorhizon]|uniref:Uncharacterized protein n=1 Tax=Lithospermum erythrorhizon TaxID=34254 RepID=A0AAV3Q5I3_LITER